MKLLEYEAKQLLQKHQLPTPKATLITKKSPGPLELPIVLKSQVPIGGRGKAGGVVIITEKSALNKTIAQLFSLPIKGHLPNVLLAEQKLAIAEEFYISLTIDRVYAAIRLTAHKYGGIEVESKDDFFTTFITHETERECARHLATYLGISPALVAPLLHNLLETFVQNDATLLEINPLVRTHDDILVCGDCKMELDDAAAFRHPDWKFEATPTSSNFVTLHPEGTIATIANGAGLAMATVDAVSRSGLLPANFLDIGGGANTQTILAAFRQIITFTHIEAIVINIFAGITRCDEVAKAIIAAKQLIPELPPLFIRLAGTNFEEAVQLLAAENIPTLASLEECLAAAKEHINA